MYTISRSQEIIPQYQSWLPASGVQCTPEKLIMKLCSVKACEGLLRASRYSGLLLQAVTKHRIYDTSVTQKHHAGRSSPAMQSVCDSHVVQPQHLLTHRLVSDSNTATARSLSIQQHNDAMQQHCLHDDIHDQNAQHTTGTSSMTTSWLHMSLTSEQ